MKKDAMNLKEVKELWFMGLERGKRRGKRYNLKKGLLLKTVSLSPLSQQLLTGDVVSGRCLLSLVSLGNFLSLTIRPPPKKGVIPFCCLFFVAGGRGSPLHGLLQSSPSSSSS